MRVWFLCALSVVLAVLKFCNKPRFMDEALSLMMRDTLPYALILHLGIATWTYSSEALLESRQINSATVVSGMCGSRLG